MPNKRASGRTVIAFWMDPPFLEALDCARAKKRQDRSTFIRQAIAEELRRRNIAFDETHVFPPDRAGKGGRKRREPADKLRVSFATETPAKYEPKKPR